MLFNSFVFALFFPTVLVLYWILSHKWQNRMLLLASYVFYGYWDWRFLFLIALSTIVDYTAGLRIDQEHGKDDPRAALRKKAWLIVSVCVNLGVLGFFKYFNFFVDSFAELMPWLNTDPNSLYLNIILPVGISFYTFQTMSYTIDIYRGKMKPTRDFPGFALYVAFFPQLVAGPIERAKALLPRILSRRTFSWSQFQEGLHLILIGLFKKVFVADNLAPVVDRIFRLSDPTGFEILLGGWAFAFQVYGDFSGYSDIARGCAKCLGIELMVNFNHPYVAPNPNERWSRWHISLSSWLRDYLYFPLGGSRSGELKTYRNLFLTMLLGGLWHGAAWNFVLWGAWEGLMLLVHRLLSPIFERYRLFSSWIHRHIRRVFNILLMFQLVSLGLIIFRGHSIPHIGAMLANVFTFKGSADLTLLLPLVQYVVPLLLYEAIQYILTQDKWDRIRALPAWTRSIVYSILFYLFAFHGAAAQSFIYFQF